MAGKINVGPAEESEEKKSSEEKKAEEKTQECRLNRLGHSVQ